MKKKFSLKFLTAVGIMLVALVAFNLNSVTASSEEMVHFNDENLKNALVVKYDTNKDGELSRGEMEEIKELDLSLKHICDISGLEYAINLEILNLNSTNVENIQPLSDLKKLSTLSLKNTEIKDIQVLSNLVNLRHLTLGTNGLSNIQPLSNLTNLEELDLMHNTISDIHVLSNLTNLRKLDLQHNKIIDIQALANLVNLEELNLNYNIDFNNYKQIENIEALSNLINLTKLDLGSNDIENIQVLSNLTKLKELVLEGNKIKDIEAITNLTNLTKLKLRANKIENIEALSSLINLKYLDLMGNKIENIEALTSLTNLNYLDLMYNEITNIQPLSGLINLTTLDLKRNFIKDFSPIKDLKIANLLKKEQRTKIIDSTTNVKMVFFEGVLPENISMNISKIQNEIINTNFKWKNLLAYDITLTSDGTEVQPEMDVEVSIPIPSDFDRSKLVAYRIEPNGEEIKYDVTIDGDFAIIKTNHFSTYVLAQTKKVTQEQVKVSPKTTIKQYKNNLRIEGTITIYNADNTEENNEEELLKTGMKVIIAKEDGTELEETIIVIGDTSGDGLVQADDLADTVKAVLGDIELSDIQFKAIDMNDNGKIEADDLADEVKLVLN